MYLAVFLLEIVLILVSSRIFKKLNQQNVKIFLMIFAY